MSRTKYPVRERRCYSKRDGPIAITSSNRIEYRFRLRPSNAPSSSIVCWPSFSRSTLLYEARFFTDFARRETKRIPSFFVVSGSNQVEFSTPESAGLGIHKGDQLLAVDGMAYKGTVLLGNRHLSIRYG
jgi:hypothetical protein